jgi:hypothetical protein
LAPGDVFPPVQEPKKNKQCSDQKYHFDEIENFLMKKMCPLRICGIENIDSDIGFGAVLMTF